MPPLLSRNVLIAAATMAFVLYASTLHRKKLSLIDSPEAVARRIDPHEKEEDGDSDFEYDIVIIGGGTAGCVLASRLSEDRKLRVLLLEAGGSSRDVLTTQVPLMFNLNMYTERDYNLFTEPQINGGGRKRYWPRAKMLGGCSSMNAMMFHWCAPSDYDEWAKSDQAGAAAWAYKNLQPYFRKLEDYVPHRAHSDVNAALRGKNGPVRIGYNGYFSNVAAKYIETCINVGIPHKPDINTPIGCLGVTRVLTYINPSGRRVTTEIAYLTQEVLKRPNLRVAVGCQVTRILFDSHGGKKRAVGVEFTKEKNGPRYRVRASKEVILSAGTIHSPHILMLSGVGPKDHLAHHGISVVQNIPGVGQGLQDHPVFGVRVPVKRPYSLSYLMAKTGLNYYRGLVALVRWLILGSGPLASNAGEAAAFLRTTDPTMFPKDEYNVVDVTSGPKAPDLETIIVPADFSKHGYAPGPPKPTVTVLAVLLRPQSWGTITLKSNDPFDAPVIDPKYLSVQNDVAIMVRGVRHILQLVNTEPFASLLDHYRPPMDLNLDELSNTELEAEVRAKFESLYHPVSTCRMVKLEDGGVVDPFLRVYGIENLRIVDASVFPTIPSGHTSAPVIAVAEKASDIIKETLYNPKE